MSKNSTENAYDESGHEVPEDTRSLARLEDEWVEEDWVGTPAGRAYHAYDAEYGNKLKRWAHENGHERGSLWGAAAQYNFSSKEWQLARKIFDEKLVELGLDEWNRLFCEELIDPSIEVPELSQEEWDLVHQARADAAVEARQICDPEHKEP